MHGNIANQVPLPRSGWSNPLPVVTDHHKKQRLCQHINCPSILKGGLVVKSLRYAQDPRTDPCVQMEKWFVLKYMLGPTNGLHTVSVSWVIFKRSRKTLPGLLQVKIDMQNES